MKPRCLAALLALAVCLQAAPDLTQPIAELKLVDGRVLHDVQLKAYNNKGVMLKHADGVAQVNYDQFPSEYREAVLAKKPAPVAPTAVTTRPPAPRPPAAKPGFTSTAGKRIPARAFEGAIFVKSGRKGFAAADVEVRIYPMDLFIRMDQNRRSALTAAHVDIRKQLNGKGPGGMPSAKTIETYYAEEFASWDILPPTNIVTRTDEQGRFSVYVPVEGEWVVFARAQGNFSDAYQYFVWAQHIREESVVLNSNNQYPMLRED